MSDRWKEYLRENQDRYLAELVELLRIPSVSTDPAYQEEVRRAAVWVANRMRQAGIADAQVMETDGHPVVYGEWMKAEDKPTLLIYGHYDVQPADPLEEWSSPPFEPRIKNGRVYARGASDMKGNILLPIIACEALLATTGTLPVNVKFLFEGEEETGSPSLEAFIAKHRQQLACDLVVIADGGVGSEEEPVVTTARRGMASLQLKVKSADTDMHSGFGGGLAPNAIHALTQILDSMRDAEGRILVDGFYDEVRPLTSAEREKIAAFPLHLDEFKTNTGIEDFFGEPEYTPQERVTARPTLDVNGVWGGYQGEGTKTVIPCEAYAKITCRLVPDQKPEQICHHLQLHIEQHAPKHVKVTVEMGPGADPYRLPDDHPGLFALERVLEEVSGNPVKRRWEGSTVPVKSVFKRILAAESVTLGGSQGDRTHAPNEFYRLNNFERIQKAFCLFFYEYGSRD
ncbi:dipeptidase [Desmospora activa]|uniref:Acetylornithine deacetylase/succinyl-diaminopimelate desuccinylase-like protein n=1 Tax=Desmospora activa DSM 45169 TaxID=1121389 RepID=A0A2T4Z818_9BACL|nr:dipeptidase [Desmospora activa]PTM58023.1 acetylornithine deacetylase/succinyl-diaminopimelate desuccinylase-like protein [Desmospora activa DSM 45169]